MTTAHAGAQTVAPNFQELDDSRVLALARRAADGVPLTEAQREYLKGAGSSAPAPHSLAQDLGLAGFSTIHDLAKAALDADSERRALITQALALVKGEAARPDDPAFFLSKIRALRGVVPTKLLQALDLSSAVSWGVVAERLYDMNLSPKREAAR